MSDKCNIDLTRDDIFADCVIPDHAVELALKVLRSMRKVFNLNQQFTEGNFMMKAHTAICGAVREVQQIEALEEVAELHSCY